MNLIKNTVTNLEIPTIPVVEHDGTGGLLWDSHSNSLILRTSNKKTFHHKVTQSEQSKDLIFMEFSAFFKLCVTPLTLWSLFC